MTLTNITKRHKIFGISVIAFTLFLINPALLPAQDYVDQFDYSVGKPYRVVDATTKQYFAQNNEIMAVKIRGRQVTIQKFNSKSLSFISENNYEDMPKGFVVENIGSVGDNYYLFYSLWDGDREMEQLFYREIDYATGKFIGKDKLLITVNGKITGSMVGSGFYSFSVVDKFSFNNNFKEDKILIQYRIKPEVRSDARNYDIIGLVVLDEGLNEVWKQEVIMPYTEKKMDNLDYAIDDAGNAYILARVYDDNTTNVRKGRKGPANYKIKLLQILAGTKNIEEVEITVGDKLISEIALFEGGNDLMYCAGYYSNSRDIDDVHGVFLFRIGSDRSIEGLRYFDIPLEVLNSYVSNRTRKRNERQDEKDGATFGSLQLRKLLARSDGSVTLIGEQYYVKEHTTTSSNGATRTYYTYHYNDMLLTTIKPDGSLGWMQKLPKLQEGRNGRGGMGFFYEFSGKSATHHLLFLDNAKNKDLELDKPPRKHSDGAGGFLTSYSVEHKTGKVHKKYLFDMRDVKGIAVYQFNVSRIIAISDYEFVVEVYKKKKEDILIKISTQ